MSRCVPQQLSGRFFRPQQADRRTAPLPPFAFVDPRIERLPAAAQDIGHIAEKKLTGCDRFLKQRVNARSSLLIFSAVWVCDCPCGGCGVRSQPSLPGIGCCAAALAVGSAPAARRSHIPIRPATMVRPPSTDACSGSSSGLAEGGRGFRLGPREHGRRSDCRRGPLRYGGQHLGSRECRRRLRPSAR